MKKFSFVVIALLVLGMVLVACSAPAEEPVVEEAPAEEAAPAEEEAAPVEEEAAPAEEEVMEEPAEEEVAEEPAEEEVAEEPAEEEVAEEPGETEGAAPAQEGGWCSDTNIVFFPGGSPGGPFAQVVANGSMAAEADLGPNV